MFTTSRYASEKARKLARKLAEENKEPYVSRGKHTIQQLAEIARKKGEERICVVEDKEPFVIATIKVSETGEWEWEK